MRILTIITTLVFCFQVYSQEKLDSLRNIDIPAAINVYQQLETIGDLRIEQYLELSGFYGQLQKMDSAFYYLNRIWDIDSSFCETGILVKSNLFMC